MMLNVCVGGTLRSVILGEFSDDYGDGGVS